MARKPKYTDTPEQFELPNMPEPTLTPLQIAKQKRQRNEDGLLISLEHQYNEDGSVNWEAMIPSEYFYANKDKFPEGTNTRDLNMDDLRPDQKIINLAGIHWAYKAAGGLGYKFTIGAAYPEFASVSCDITWRGTYESDMKEITSSGVGEAHSFNNIEPFKYLVSILSMNKAFSRAVRDRCGIKSYATDELRGEKGDKENPSTNSNIEPKGSSPNDHLEFVAASAGHTFEKVKNHYLKVEPDSNKKDLATKWESYKDIPPLICLEISAKIEKAEANKKR